MAYEKQNFEENQILKAVHLNTMEDGIAANSEVLDTVTETMNTINTNVIDVKSTVETVNTNVSSVKTDVASVKTDVGTVNTNVSALSTKIDSINTNISTALGGADARLLAVAASDTTNLTYDSMHHVLYVNHSTYGLLGFKVIAYNADGSNIVTLMCTSNVLSQVYNSSNSGWTWASSAVRTWLRGTFYNGLPSSIKNIIQTVSKKTNAPASSTLTAANETVFLLSREEYYTLSDIVYPHIMASSVRCWLRSPFTSSSSNACYVNYVNGTVNYSGVNDSYGVLPCFCIA